MNPTFATAAIALYVAHHVGDYWVQTDHQARHKGAPGAEGRIACLKHVGTYTLTQAALLGLVVLALGPLGSPAGWALALGVSAWTHYTADRREYGLMFKLARLIPGKADFMELGKPRNLATLADWEHPGKGQTVGRFDPVSIVPLDTPSLGTGAWALDQSWHIAFGVFVPALLLACI